MLGKGWDTRPILYGLGRIGRLLARLSSKIGSGPSCCCTHMRSRGSGVPMPQAAARDGASAAKIIEHAVRSAALLTNNRRRPHTASIGYRSSLDESRPRSAPCGGGYVSVVVCSTLLPLPPATLHRRDPPCPPPRRVTHSHSCFLPPPSQLCCSALPSFAAARGRQSVTSTVRN